jgi:ATP-binding cassette subfamily B protein
MAAEEKERAADYPATLRGQFRKNIGLYGLGLGLLVTQSVLLATRDLLVRTAVNAVDASKSIDARNAAITMLAASAGAGLTRWLSRITIFNGGRNVEYELRAVLLARLHALGPSFFRKMPTGDIMSRATNDLTQVRLLLGFGVLNSLSSLLSLASALYVMATVSIRLTLATLLTFPVLMLVTRRFSTQLFKRNRENQEAIGAMSDRVLASLAGVRVVRSFALEDQELAAFEKANASYVDKGLALARLRGSMQPIVGAVTSAGALIVFWYGGSLVLNGTMTKGDLLAFWMALYRLMWPMLALGFVFAILQRGRASWSRLETIMQAIPEVVSGALPAPAQVRGGLEVKDLRFGYGERKVIDGVSFKVPAGDSLAIVGRTGSGKSTIAVLLARLMPTPKGSVFLDGDDVCDLPLSTVRASIGYAQQDAFLFSTTVTRNIGFSLDDPESAESTEKIQGAAAEAEVLAEVRGLPDGFDTVVGERGVQLSGGQRQRVALARALLREPSILVLDDPLSAVDAKTESSILGAIERQAAKRTVVLITHRVAAARRCDSILVLDEGKVIESGTHDELLKNGGLYATFAEEQRIEEDLAALSELEVEPPSKEPEAAS